MAHLGGRGLWPVGPVIGVVLPPLWHRGHKGQAIHGILRGGAEGDPVAIARTPQGCGREPRILLRFGGPGAWLDRRPHLRAPHEAAAANAVRVLRGECRPCRPHPDERIRARSAQDLILAGPVRPAALAAMFPTVVAPGGMTARAGTTARRGAIPAFNAVADAYILPRPSLSHRDRYLITSGAR
jgi:hypothetical protein